MNREVFILVLKDRMEEMNLSEQCINKHLNVFKKCFEDKTDEEVDTLINDLGGIKGVLTAIYDLEKKKETNYKQEIQEIIEKVKTEPQKDNEMSIDLSSEDNIQEETSETVQHEEKNEDPPAVNNEPTENISPDEKKEEIAPETEKKEPIPAPLGTEKKLQPLRTRKIRSKTIPFNNNSDKTSTFDITEQVKIAQQKIEQENNNVNDFQPEKQTPDKPKRKSRVFKEVLNFIGKSRTKLPDKVFKANIPVFFIFNTLLVLLSALIYPLNILLYIACIAFFVVFIICGGVIFGWGVVTFVTMMISDTQMTQTLPESLYEIGIGLISLGASAVVCIFLYIFTKKIIPIIYNFSKKCVRTFLKCYMAYFKKKGDTKK